MGWFYIHISCYNSNISIMKSVKIDNESKYERKITHLRNGKKTLSKAFLRVLDSLHHMNWSSTRLILWNCIPNFIASQC